ncbi:hypothetical protein ESCOCP322M1_23470 [Escherichia coli]
MAAVEHPQFHHFKRHHVLHKLRAYAVPLRTTINEIIFNDPLAERLTGDGARIVNPELAGDIVQGFRRRGRHDAVNHGAREGDVGFNPVRQRGIARFRQPQHGGTRHVAVFPHVIAGHHGKRLQPLFAAQAQRFHDIANGGFWLVRLGQVVLDQRIIKVEFATGGLGAVTFFGHGQGDNGGLLTRHGGQNACAAVNRRVQRLFHRADNFQFGALCAFFRHGIQQILFFQVFDQRLVIAGHQVDFADAPVAVGLLQQMMGI